jgi:2-hydroxy-3-oxopropionate reductase
MSEKKEKVGFIGLGIMGKPMSKNLLKAGYPLAVFDIVPESVNELVAVGARKATSSREAAAVSDVTITMLPDSAQVEQAVLGGDGVLEGIRPGTVYIDMSSINPLVSQRIYKRIEAKGAHMLDAPVSGSETKAIDGSLAIMVGGKAEIFNRCKRILESMGKNPVLVGDIGAGNLTKLVNQIIVALNIAAFSEAFVLGAKAGLDPEKVFEAIKNGAAGSVMLNQKIPSIMERNFKPGFKIALQRKDLKNALEVARDMDVPLPLTSLVQQELIALTNEGEENNDHSAICHFIERLAKTEIRRGSAKQNQ